MGYSKSNEVPVSTDIEGRVHGQWSDLRVHLVLLSMSTGSRRVGSTIVLSVTRDGNSVIISTFL